MSPVVGSKDALQVKMCVMAQIQFQLNSIPLTRPLNGVSGLNNLSVL